MLKEQFPTGESRESSLSKARNLAAAGLMAGLALTGAACETGPKSTPETTTTAKDVELKAERFEKLNVDKIRKSFLKEAFAVFGNVEIKAGQDFKEEEGTKETGEFKSFELKNDGKVTLFTKDWEEKITDPASPDDTIIHAHEGIGLNEDHMVFGDIDGDGNEDAVFISGKNEGGTIVAYSLNFALNKNGSPEIIASEELGNSPEIQSLSVGSRSVTVKYRFFDVPNEEYTAYTKVFRYAGGKIFESQAESKEEHYK